MVERITGQNCKPHLESLVFGNDDTDTHTPVRVLAQTHKYAHSRTGKKGKHEQTNLIHWHVVTQDMTEKKRRKQTEPVKLQLMTGMNQTPSSTLIKMVAGRLESVWFTHRSSTETQRESNRWSLQNATKLDHHSTTTTAGTT